MPASVLRSVISLFVSIGMGAFSSRHKETQWQYRREIFVDA
jgi:hypothetical protein